MRSLLEKAIVHVLNGESDKAEAVFHRFMVEKARGIHEKLRESEDMNLDPNWEDEINNEEYFDDADMGDDTADHDDMPVDAGDEVEDMGDDVDSDVDADMDDDVDADMDGDDVDGGMQEKMDDLEDKIAELTAEFDRLMSEFESDEGHDADAVDDLEAAEGDLEDADADLEDVEGEVPAVDGDDQDDLADRMEDDMGTDDEEPEDMTVESFDFDDEELDDITESVLADLAKIAAPHNKDFVEVGDGKTIAGNKDSMLPHHGVEDRVKGAKPASSKGGNHDSFSMETPPGSKPVTNSAKNSRKKMTDGTSKVSKEGDASAKLNHDFATRPATKPTIDGKPSKK